MNKLLPKFFPKLLPIIPPIIPPTIQTVYGYEYQLDDTGSHLSVFHDGDISWDVLFDIKNAIWGDEARAIEVYPAKSALVCAVNCRHLWRLGPNDYAPDLLGDDGNEDSLQGRQAIAWAEARK